MVKGRRTTAVATVVGLLGCHRAFQPVGRASMPECPEGERDMRVLSEDPAVPFALVSGSTIKQAGLACCEAFSRAPAYFAVDRWGQTGSLQENIRPSSDKADEEEVCRSAVFRDANLGELRDILYVSRPLQAVARPAELTEALEVELETELSTLTAGYESRLRKVPAEVAVFPLTAPKRPYDGVTDGLVAQRIVFAWQAARTQERYVVVGGDFLAVFRLEPHMHLVCAIDALTGLAPFPYRPRGIVALDAGAEPEVVFREAASDGWQDVIVTIEKTGCPVRARSVGGDNS